MPAGREYLQAVEPQWLFYALAALAAAVFALGTWRRVSLWLKSRRGTDLPGRGRMAALVVRDGLLNARLFKASPGAGVSHILILWGFLGLFLGTAAISVDHYLVSFLRGRVYLVFSAAMEVLGLFLLLGLVWVMIRRFVLRAERLERRWEDLTVPLALLAVALSGFMVESARLAGDGPPWASWSFGGKLLTGLWSSPQAARAAHGALWWVHALLSLGLIAWLPYSKLFHSLAAPVSLALQDQPLEAGFPEDDQEDGGGDREEADPEAGTGVLLSFRESVHLDACTRCGLCLEVCPVHGAAEPLAPRTLLGDLRARRSAMPGEVWYCTTCRACYQVCPVAVAPLAVIRKVRAAIVEEGSQVPPQLGEGLEKLYKYANPWVAKKGRKADWMEKLPPGEPDPGAEPELLYFVGCTTSLETRAQGLARSLDAILRSVGVAYTTLGKKEPCCGDIARQLGERGLFADQRDKTLRALEKAGPGRVVTSSPHCLDSFVKAYPKTLSGKEGDTPFQAVHYTQFLDRLLEQGRLEFKRQSGLRVTYHDPCYLARHNGILEPPRKVLGAIPGLELREMADHGLNSLCCGGGGGRMWQELEGQARPAQGTMAHRRLAQARATGAGVVVTACPLCLIMLEDGRKTGGFEDDLEIMDLAELAALCLGLAAAGDEEE